MDWGELARTNLLSLLGRPEAGGGFTDRSTLEHAERD